jgi:hypothetical protein
MVGQAQKARTTSGDLGDLVAGFRGRLRVVPWLVIGLVAGLWVWHGATAVWAIAGVAVGAAGAAGLFLLGFSRSRQLSVQVYSGGLAYRAKGTQETWTWDEVEEFFVLAEEREIHGGVPHGIVDAIFSSLLEAAVKAALPKAARYQVRYRICRPGHQRTFDSQVRGYARLGAMVEAFVTRAQLPKALASFGSGESIRFGELGFGPDGLRYAGAKHPRCLPLSALADVSVTRYAVKVRQAGHRLAWLTAERSAVPNVAVLAGLAEHIVTARPHDSDKAAPSRAPGMR